MPTADDLPLLMLPGTLCDARVFAATMAALGRPAATIEMAGERRATAMARRVLATAPERFALLGFSLGAIVALEIIAQAPERVERLALLGANARAMPAEQQPLRCESFLRAMQQGVTSQIDEVWDLSVPAARQDDAGLRAELLAMAAATPLSVLRQQAEIAIHRADRRYSLGDIAVPTLIACGAEDGICPPALSREIAAAIPGARLAIVEGAGHYLTLDQPQYVAGLLADWLAAPAATRRTVSKEFT